MMRKDRIEIKQNVRNAKEDNIMKSACRVIIVSMCIASGSIPAWSQASATTVQERAQTPNVTATSVSGTTNSIAKFLNSTDLGSSVLYDTGGKIGLGTTNPADVLHVVFNDPNGDRCLRLTRRAIEMFLADADRRSPAKPTVRSTKSRTTPKRTKEG